MRPVLHRAAAVVFVAVLSAAARPQPESPKPNESEILRSFRQHDYPRAAELIDQSLQDSPRDPRLLYNAACARSLMGEQDQAGKFLLQAVQAGFRDFSHMRRDADLDGMRGHPMYRAMISARDAADPMLAKREVDRWRREHGEEAYRFEDDPEHKIQFITWLDDARHQAMRDMLDREADQLSRTLFAEGRRHYIIIAVPTPADAAKLLPERHVHGSYQHSRGLLISVDAGSALRHEFFHALHHHHMDQIGQQHPLWIQEGLAALYEDYEIQDDGSIRFLPNERRNIVKAMSREGRLIPLDRFVAMSDADFAADPAGNYAQARAVFEFVAEQNLLGGWYAAYVRNFRVDSTGMKAILDVLQQSPANMETQWRQWLDSKSTIVSQIPRKADVVKIPSHESSPPSGE